MFSDMCLILIFALCPSQQCLLVLVRVMSFLIESVPNSRNSVLLEDRTLLFQKG